MLSRYPQGGDFKKVVKWHLYDVKHSPKETPFYEKTTSGQNISFTIDFSPHGRLIEHNSCTVIGDMAYLTWSYGLFAKSDNSGILGNATSWKIHLRPTQLKLLKSSIARLPVSSPPAKRDDLHLLTSQNPKGWETRLYDRNHLPNQMREIYKIVGLEA